MEKYAVLPFITKSKNSTVDSTCRWQPRTRNKANIKLIYSSKICNKYLDISSEDIDHRLKSEIGKMISYTRFYKKTTRRTMKFMSRKIRVKKTCVNIGPCTDRLPRLEALLSRISQSVAKDLFNCCMFEEIALLQSSAN